MKWFQFKIRVILFILMCFLPACSSTGIGPADRSTTDTPVVLFDAANVIQDKWRHLPIKGTTEYRVTAEDGGVAIQAVGKNSASGLIRTINIDTQNCSILEWRWRVEKLQHNANLKDKEGEDVGASIFLLFGDPGFMSSPTPVPTLRYVWTNDRHSKGDVIENPYLPGVVQSVVIRAGQRGNWFTESRNLRQDYEQAFGAPPKATVHAIVLFTDNDQTKEPAVAFYRWAKVHCEQAVSLQAQLPN